MADALALIAVEGAVIAVILCFIAGQFFARGR